LHSWYLRDLDNVNSFGKVFVLFQYFEIALQILLSALSAQVLTSPIKKTKKIWLSIWLLFLMIINVFFSGNRIYFALLIIYLGCFLLLKRHYKKIIKLAIVMPFVLLFFSLWTSLRADLGSPSETYKKYVENISNDDQASMSFIANITELSNVMLLIHITKDYGGKYDFLYGATYSRALTFIVPRSLYVNRPENFSKIIAEKYEPGADTSLSSTVIGEMYANFGIFSIVLLPTFTALVCFISRRYAKFLNSKPLTNIIFFMFFVWLSRSTFSENFIAFSLAYFLIIALKIEKKSNESLDDTNSPLKCDLSR
jgi:oligosaccharide repeat unit polymerase